MVLVGPNGLGGATEQLILFGNRVNWNSILFGQDETDKRKEKRQT